MGKNDVVKHDLPVDAQAIDWDAVMEPVETWPQSRRAAVLAEAPTDTMLTGQILQEAPYRSVGKMALQFTPEKTLFGSGWVVAPRAFITAGHCVYHIGKGGWIIKGQFCPRYDNACTKYFKVATVYTLQGWIDRQDEADRQYDMAACVVTEEFTASEPPIEFAAYTLPALQYAAVGYPAKPNDTHDFNGKRMWQSYGNFIQLSSGILSAENDLTGGASGGPWLQASENDAVGGITVYRRPDSDPNVALSPEFAEGFMNLYNAVKDL